MVGSCVRSNEPLVSIKVRGIIVAILENISFPRRNLLHGVSKYAEESLLYQSVSFLTAIILLRTFTTIGFTLQKYRR